MISTPLELAVELGRRLDELRIPYLVGGSVASAILGEPRTTVDVDFIVDLSLESLARLLDRLESDFYFDRETAQTAVTARRSFNIIHLATSIKVDFFVIEESAHARSQLSRHVFMAVDASGAMRVRLHLPEDLIVWKLRWFRAGGEMSDRQWRDALGVMKIQRSNLDFDLLEEEARRWNVIDLLHHAYEQAGIQR